MSGGRPASLDGSLLARKGGATPAIQDESPLVLQLEAHRPEPAIHVPAPQVEESEPAAEVGDDAGGGASDDAGNAWRDMAVRIGRDMAARMGAVSPRLYLAGVAVIAVVAAAAFWPLGGADEPLPVRADVSPAANDAGAGETVKIETVVDTQASGTAANAPSLQTMPAVAIPAVVTVPAADAPAPKEAVAASLPAVPQTKPVFPVKPVNAPAAGTPQPRFGEVEAAPEIPAEVPKTVSPVPVPRAKPEIAAVPTGPYAVQLASIGSEKRATAEAFRLQKHLASILGGREIRVEKAVVKGRGTTYRLRASGYRTQTEARTACKQIGRLKVDCLPIRR